MKTKDLIKGSMISLAVLAPLFFGACSGDSSKEDKISKEASSAKTPDSAKIEIVKNENAQEIKVALKKADENQSKSYYYDYNKDEEHSSKKPRTTLDANLHVRSPYESVEVSMLVKKLSKEFILKCSACHNDYANGVIGPSLLGKKVEYIYDKIIQFKNGTQKNVLMKDLVSQMSDEEIRSIAQEIHEFNEKIQQMRK